MTKLVLSARARVAAMFALVLFAFGELKDRFVTAIRGERITQANGVELEPSQVSPIAAPRRIITPREFGVPLLLVQTPMIHAAKTGTLSVADLRAVTYQSAAEFGINTISEVFARDLGVHSGIMQELVAFFADVTADRQRIYGTTDTSQMSEVDEFGRAPTKKIKGGTTVGFPLKAYQYAVGWTRKYLQNHTPAELADQLLAAKKAQVLQVSKEVKKAFYLSGNYTFNDFLVDKVDLNVKRLLNADGAPIPDGPNGEVFVPGSHTHYDAIAGLTAASLTALINDVVEHGHGGTVVVVINKADEAAVRALTGFTAYTDPRIQLGTGTVATKRLDITRLDNRAIGIFGAAEVWVKPWGIANYALAFDSGTGNKPLVIRTRDGAAPSLAIAAEIDMFPLHAQYMETEFGVGVWNRTNGAVLYFGGGAYVDPTIV